MPDALSVGSTACPTGSYLEQNTDVLSGVSDKFVPNSTGNTGEWSSLFCGKCC